MQKTFLQELEFTAAVFMKAFKSFWYSLLWHNRDRSERNRGKFHH